MADPKVHDRFNPPGDPGIDCTGDKQYTMQEFKDEVDINRIMGRVLKGQQQLPPDLGLGTYGDFSFVEDYQSALELQARAAEQFMALPAKVRDRFANDPALFLEWIHHPGTSLAEANELGLLREETAARLKAQAELEAAQAKVAAQQPTVVVPPGGVVTSTLKTT